MTQARSSFGADVRHELALLVEPRACCQLSELQGVLAAASTREEGDVQVVCHVTSNVAARKVVRLSHLLSGADESQHEAHFRRGRTRVRPSYDVALARDPGTPLETLGADVLEFGRECCRRSFLRGAFIAAGVISAGAGGTHIEFSLTSEPRAAAAAEALAALGVRPRIRRRGKRWMVYAKGSDDVALLMQAMGASAAVLHFENDRILRELRGDANRRANSETANLRRSVATGLRQVAAVHKMAASGVLDRQPQALREMAALRVSMPAATLDQLAGRLGLTKSAINARLRRLVTVAAEAGLVDS